VKLNLPEDRWVIAAEMRPGNRKGVHHGRVNVRPPDSDYMKAATELNEVAEKAQPAGMLIGYHNHDNEFKEIDRALIYDALMRQFDARLVKMQFQTSVVSLGYEAATYFRKYPGRYISIHLADWSPTEKKQVPIGKGVINWKELFAAAKTAGVRNYFVEMNLDLMQASIPYLHELR